ncbi:hypothetical protein KY345_02855 [Candidatus Woesearchaeota archaeon]|nr:hypothetical protein [Candidatus Woesearchaeota archaeon]
MEELLGDAKPENYFVTRDGQRIKNLYQLQKSLLNMNDDTFNHHVNNERNDFYNWVKDIYKDEALSSVVLNCRAKNELAQKLKDRIEEAIQKKKKQDVRNIIDEAKREIQEKRRMQEEAEKREAEIERKKEAKEREQIRRTSKPQPVKKAEIKKPEPKPEAKKEPKTEKHVFVDRPPRAKEFTEEERTGPISNATYMKVSVIDFVFGIIIGIIAILILKQLF